MKQQTLEQRILGMLKSNAEEPEEIKDGKGTFTTFRVEYIINDIKSLIKQENSERTYSYGSFELCQDEETGRLYWWGAEDGWKDPTEIGEEGVLTMKAEHFKLGTTLTMREPFSLEE